MTTKILPAFFLLLVAIQLKALPAVAQQARLGGAYAVGSSDSRFFCCALL